MEPREEATRIDSQEDLASGLSKSGERAAWEAAFGTSGADRKGAGDKPAGNGNSPGGRAKSRRAEGESREWPPLSQGLEVAGPDQREYPMLPGFTGQIVDSTERLSGCSRPVAALGAIGALSALSAWDWDVKTLAPDPKPLSVHVFASSETTWRKSTAWEPLWRPHLEAVEEVEAAWLAATAQFVSLSEEDRRREHRPRVHNPQMTRGELTIEALKVRLDTGRPCQALFSDEAGEVLRWSYQGARMSSTLSFLSKAFDGRELYDDKLVVAREIALRRYRFQVVLAGQGAVMVHLITHPAASNGFAGRALVAKDDRRPPRLEPPDEDDHDVLRQYSAMIRAHRRRQDEGLELAATVWNEPQILRIDTDAEGHLLQFHEEMETLADSFFREGRFHE